MLLLLVVQLRVAVYLVMGLGRAISGSVSFEAVN